MELRDPVAVQYHGTVLSQPNDSVSFLFCEHSVTVHVPRACLRARFLYHGPRSTSCKEEEDCCRADGRCQFQLRAACEQLRAGWKQLRAGWEQLRTGWEQLRSDW